MSRRRPAAAAAGMLGIALALAACAPAPPSTVTISYTLDGEERTAVAHPQEIECTETEVSVLGMDRPLHSVQLSFGTALGSYGRVWVHEGDKLVYITVDGLHAERDGERIRIESAPGEVKYVAHAASDDDPAGEFDVDGARELEGSLTVDLLCAGGDPGADSDADAADAASAPVEPTVEIAYEIDGRSEMVVAHPDDVSCTDNALVAFAGGEHASSAMLPAEGSDSGSVSGHVLDDVFVAFQGVGFPQVVTDADGAVRGSVVGAEGTATIVEIPEGEHPTAGDIDLADGTRVPATMTATVVCPAG